MISSSKRRIFILFLISFFIQKALSQEASNTKITSNFQSEQFISMGFSDCKNIRAMDFETAWRRVVESAPTIAAAEMEICVREKEKIQVSQRLNPVAALAVENIGVKHPDADAEPIDTTFVLSQTFELGGKRGARKAFASSLTAGAFLDAQIERQNLRHALKTVFIEISTLQEKLNLANERQAMAEDMLKAVRKLVEAGKVSSIEEKKSQIALKFSILAVREAITNLSQAKKRLSSMWGSLCPDFDCVVFDLFDCTCPPSQCSLIEEVSKTPDYAKARQLILSAEKNLNLQRANSLPDLTLSLGLRTFNDSSQSGVIIGAAMPLAIFNRNQGNIAKAQCEINLAQFQLMEVERELREKVFVIQDKLNAYFDEAELFRGGILQEAIDAFHLTERGYKQGKAPYIDLLEAQKMLFEIQEKYIDILFEYHLSEAELVRLVGECIVD